MSSASEAKRPPLSARLFWYKLTSDELCLLKAMVEHCSDGSTIRASDERLGSYSKLGDRKVRSLINGYKVHGKHTKRAGEYVPGLLARHILTKIAPAIPGKRKPPIYRLNEEMLELDTEMKEYRRWAPWLPEHQWELPGIEPPPAPGDPIEKRVKPAPRPPAASAVVPGGVTSTPPAASAPDSKTLDPKALDPETRRIQELLTQHADGAISQSVRSWLATKELLKQHLTAEEWNLWVRPARLLRTLSGNGALVAVPPSNRIMQAAAARKELLAECAHSCGFRAAFLTRYPDEWERERSKEEWGIEFIGSKKR